MTSNRLKFSCAMVGMAIGILLSLLLVIIVLGKDAPGWLIFTLVGLAAPLYLIPYYWASSDKQESGGKRWKLKRSGRLIK